FWQISCISWFLCFLGCFHFRPYPLSYRKAEKKESGFPSFPENFPVFSVFYSSKVSFSLSIKLFFFLPVFSVPPLLPPPEGLLPQAASNWRRASFASSLRLVGTCTTSVT